MQDQELTEFKSYAGNLKADGDSAPITFQVCIDKTGEVKFKFDAVTLTKETSFIKNWWNGEGSNIKYFSLSGKAEDGTEFKTEDLHFNSLPIKYNEETGSYISPIGGCSRAEFNLKLAALVPKPQLYMCVKGFQSLHQLSSECHLGKVIIGGNSSIDEPDTISGYIAVQSDNEPADLTVWHTEAGKLLEHVRWIMSFASSIELKRPIIKFYTGDDMKVIALSQTRQASINYPTFNLFNQQPVFYAAVSSFFFDLKVKKLLYAIEWFTMEFTHNEIRLVNAMTALENLVASNLDDDDTLILPEKEFERIELALREMLIKCFEEKTVATDRTKKAAKVALKAYETKFNDFNRLSIYQKLTNFAKGWWQVSLDGITENKIKEAIKARNRIVHRGHYYDDGKEESNVALWEHTLIVREIVVRFLLAAIGYRGTYISYIGGCHNAQFPPQTDFKDAN
ncbi:hypothetical protein B0F87_107171 [Methylobacter tundripaludum]|uniref:Uncharacterized protein n=1 Tax=Methylobacter tundripaludum TaxID=173365 RepID=A0A2S6HBU4_9GAMM|nr:HEPN domain-containing protein [Methylobacter tundripaludum]PPK74928.1 hypothetical protein B0F87_107171 [Methylobacter tundripaludum]